MLKSVHGRSRRSRIGVMGGALLTGAVLVVAGLSASPASAEGSSCLTTGVVTTCTFRYTGTATNWPVPPGVTSLTVVADGGAGGYAHDLGDGPSPAGGPGGEYKATLTGIPARTTLSVFPGAAYSGGGTGGYPILVPEWSGAGGQATTIAIAPSSVASMLVVAGGGGGTGFGDPTVAEVTGGAGGGSGQVDGSAGQDGGIPGGGGGGGTTANGGAGGTLSDCVFQGAVGGQFQGGNAAYDGIHPGDCAAGGGGGSGYFGGGGAGGGGGGGGSGFPAARTVVGGITVIPDTSDTNTNTGYGVVTISYKSRTATGPIVSGYRAALCLTGRGGSAANDTPVVIAACAGSPGQTWTVSNSGTLHDSGKCLDVYRDEKTDKAPVELWTCTGSGNQQWQSTTTGALLNPVSGKCLDDPRFSTAPGTQLEIYTCNGGANQRWKLPGTNVLP